MERRNELGFLFASLVLLSFWDTGCSSSQPAYEADASTDTGTDLDTDTDTDSDTDTSESCDEFNPCGDHGTCDDTSGIVQCECDEGWAGEYCDQCAEGYHTEGPDCVLDEECEADSCNFHGTCDDTTGVVVCSCDDGWDGDFCTTCASGYHPEEIETSDGGTGEEACVLDQTCLPTSCAGHGICDDSSGIVVCDCETGYVGDFCTGCDAGYHEDGDSCVLDEACPETGACNDHGTCDDSTGDPICTCDEGWDGDTCNTCEAGFHPDGEECVLDETCLPNTCDGHGSCDDSGPTVVCDCDPGYLLPFCSDCDGGYHVDGDDCVIDEVCDAEPYTATCSGNGDCAVVDGVVECTCDYGWNGDTCNTCAPGFHSDGEDCVIDESCLAGEASCSYHGTCDDSTGYIVCACDANFNEANYCATCDVGFHLVGDACVADEDCLPSPCGTHGDCVLVGYEEECDCDVGWAGDTCAECAAGYHDVGGDCVLQESCLPGEASCSYHGTCDDLTGYVVCTCDTGYDAASYCATCESGYHLYGGSCVVDETCPPSGACSGHGSCSVVGGEAVCSCDTGYAGDLCASCAPGFQDNDVNGTCLADCDLGTLTCVHGVCEDSDGTAGCACTSGWSGALCDACMDDSYEDNDYDSLAYLLPPGGLSATDLAICGTDKDWFAIYLAETAVLDVDVLFTHFSGGDIDLYLWYLFDSSPSSSNLVAYSNGTTSNESASYTVPTGSEGRYLVEIRGDGPFTRNTYDLGVNVTGPSCNTCEYLGNDCGQWDDACGGEIDCDSLCPGLGTTHVCEEYQWGTCAQYYDDLWYGCCEGNTVHTLAWGTPFDVNCTTSGRECGWRNATDLPPRTGYFRCNNIGTSDPVPPGVFSTCPAGMGWEP